MEEEKKKDVTGEEEAVEKPSDSETEKKVGEEEVDNQGVPLKNRLAESERKRKALEERMTKVEELFTQQNSAVQYPYQPQQPMTSPQQQEQTDQTKLPPETQKLLDDWYGKKRSQERLQEADMWLFNQDPQNWTNNSQEAMGIIRSNAALQNQFNADPLGAAKQAKKILDARREVLKKPKEEPVGEEESKVKEQERIAKIKETTTTSGKTTPAPKKDKVDEAYKKAVDWGSNRDIADYFKSKLE